MTRLDRLGVPSRPPIAVDVEKRRGWVRREEGLNTLDAAGFARAVAPAGPR